MREPLLILEDETVLGGELAEHFSEQGGWRVTWLRSLSEAREQLFERELEPLVVLADMNLGDGNSLDLLGEARRKGQRSEWILLTGYGTVPDSVRALRLGAYDFLEKPCDLERLDLVIAGAARSARAQRRLEEDRVTSERRYGPEAFLGRSAAAREVRELLRQLAAAPFSSLLLSGETGSGKGLAARILHHSGSRAAAPLVEINCAALPRELLESELFGHEAGAFTGARGRRRGLFERAHGGTLFLDEIGELPPELQAKLLTAIEDRRFRRLGGDEEISIDVRVVAASNRDLPEASARGDFRADLYHRLAVFSVALPPLRDRIEDLRDLVPALIEEFNAKAGKQVTTVSEEAWARMERHAWPGNVRELRNVVERCVLLSFGPELPLRWLHLEPSSVSPPSSTGHGSDLVVPLDGSLSLDEIDRRIVKAALERAGGNVTAAARSLGTTRETMRYRIQKHGL